jgi:hypothetical protein
VANRIAALAVLFLFAHILTLPPTLEDIDSINFALGVRDFEVARHQPHPPGYPVFIALGKVSTRLLQAFGVESAAPRALALWSVLSGAALIALLFALYHQLARDRSLAWWAMAIAVSSPLFWFTALRPLSDMTGLAFAVGAQVLLIAVLMPKGGGAGEPGAAESAAGPAHTGAPPNGSGATIDERRTVRRLILGAALCGFAAGVRVQTLALTAPLLAAAIIWPAAKLTLQVRSWALLAFGVGVLLWGIPLLAASGGLSNYLVTLGIQADQDFTGVVMLWTTRQVRVAISAFLYTFVWPWGSLEIGGLVLLLAVVGAIRAVRGAPRPLVILLIAFVPYAAFHLLFHETVTVRYALPLVVPLAFLAAYALDGLGRLGLPIAAATVVLVSLAITAPAARAYGRDGSPAFTMFERAVDGAAAGGPGAPAVVGMHAVMRRVDDWTPDTGGIGILRAPHGGEWLALVDHWRRQPASPVRFLAEPRHTDLALFDHQARSLEASGRWSFRELPFVAGTRPGPVDLYVMQPPGWMLDRGWALTAQVGGITARDGLGPHIRPSVAWVRARSEPSLLAIGGRNLMPAGGPAARVTLESRTGPIDAWNVVPGFFFRLVSLPLGTLEGDGYVPLQLRATPADQSGQLVPVALEQFDLQQDGTVMLGYVDGWHEPEHDPITARSWRWMSRAGTIWIRPVGREVTLTLAGESPLRYFSQAPVVRVLAGGIELSRFSPAADFTHVVRVPPEALAANGGQIVIESDLWFTPAERSGAGDRRQLALRMYGVSAAAAAPAPGASSRAAYPRSAAAPPRPPAVPTARD